MTSKTPTTKDSGTKKPAPKTTASKTAATQEITPEQPIAETTPSAKKSKSGKKKIVRDKFSFPAQDYAQLCGLKKTSIAAGIEVKKGELVRAGLNLLAKLSVAELRMALEKVEKIKKH